ncbi:MAG: polymer-forming cytoskeletal protein [Candidatus Auribacterota bacterium]|jgi:hypothetical protein|nr:polymer-forming cytoskeletal protein [Candidatus Auribacterota bacterium]
MGMKSFFSKSFGTQQEEETARKHTVIEVVCPHCKNAQTVSEGAISAFCKQCKKIFDVQQALKNRQQPKEEPQDIKQYSTSTKNIRCSACSTWQDVPSIAISAFCKKCGQRINLQDYKKNDLFRGDLETKGTLYITNSGEVDGTVSVGEAIIDGKFKGKLIAEGIVRLQPGSTFLGELYAPKLEVSDGATFVGSSNVQPDFYSAL